MIIGVDAACLSTHNTKLQAGVYYVALNLLKELEKVDKKNTYLLYSFAPIPKDILKQFPKNWMNRVIPSFGWLYISLPFALLKDKPDVFLALSQAMPHFTNVSTIGFIHALDFDEAYHPGSYKKLKRNSEFLISHADALITTSEFLKKELEETYHKRNISVISPGVTHYPAFHTKTVKTRVPYFLFVGTFKPSKNIPTIIRAFLTFCKTTQKRYNLYLIGSDFWLDTDLQTLINKHGKTKHIKIFPSVPNAELGTYYKNALAFISPSLYEGFGMTFLEAMFYGCPVIGSTVGALPSMIGNAGLLSNPYDVNVFAMNMKKIAESKILRKSLAAKGRKKVKQYSWIKYAKKIFAEIQKYEKPY